ncbi:MAG TPA: hypothetical protein VFA24_06180 [Gaiellaceae bacterium]|nr:hypothetical protein [Gaiellaceae bacterium]
MIVALIIAWFALVALLLYRETHRGRIAGDQVAALAWRAGQRLWAVSRMLAALLLVYFQIVRHGASRTRPADRT